MKGKTMARITFQSYPYAVSKTFDCPECGKTKRKRTFRAECTVNPFNKGDDGNPRTVEQVKAQSKQKATTQAEEFMRAPLCSSCEKDLSFTAKRLLYKVRKVS